MDSDSDTENYCELYTSAGSYYKAVKDSLHIDFNSLLKEEELEKEASEKEKINLTLEESEINQESSNSKPADIIANRVSTKRGRATRSKRCVNNESSTESTACTAISSIDIELPVDITSCEAVPQRGGGRKRGRQRGGGRKRGARNNGQEVQLKQAHVIGPTIVLDPPDSPPRPPPLRDGHISLSDDSDSEVAAVSARTPVDENEEVSVKVWWQFGRFDKFAIRKFQKLESIFVHYSKSENIPQNQVLLLINDTPILPSDTPDSLKLGAASIIEGGVISYENGEENTSTSNQVERALRENEIELKILRKGQKKPLLIRIEKTHKMQVLLWKCAETLEIPVEKLKLVFDGETLNPSDTPDDLDLEGGECFELYLLN